MATLGDLKARIADDLARSDLTSQIADAIEDAIDEYKDRRLGFNEVVSSALPFVSGTASYAVPTDLQAIDAVVHVDTGGETQLGRIQYQTYLNWIYSPSTNIGQPCSYAVYDEKFFFYPTPDSSADTYKVSYLQDLGAPASDELENAWTNQGRNLIRARAKGDLYAHVIRDMAEAQFCFGEAERQLQRLSRQARRLRSSGTIMAHEL